MSSSTIYSLKNFIALSFFFCVSLPLLILYLSESSYTLSSLSIVASNSVDNSMLYLDYFNNDLEYNVLQKNDNYTLLTRLSTKNNSTKVYHTLLDNNFTQITEFEEVQTDLSGDVSLVLNGDDITQINLSIGNSSITLQFKNPLTSNNLQGSISSTIPLKLGNYDIENFNLQEEINNDIFNKLRLLLTPSTPIQENKRVLLSTTPTPPPKFPVSPTLQECLVNLSHSAYNLVHTALEGICYSPTGKPLNVIAFAGTNSITTQTLFTDILNDVRGAIIDNYRQAYIITNITTLQKNKQYDIITGHSLGGAIAKYAVQNNLLNTGALITFGTPLPTYTNSFIPSTQFINTKDEPNTCCSYGLLSCSKYGVSITDPVSQVLSGTHSNIVYVNNGVVVNPKYLSCQATLAYTLYETGLTLHIPLISDY